MRQCSATCSLNALQPRRLRLANKTNASACTSLACAFFCVQAHAETCDDDPIDLCFRLSDSCSGGDGVHLLLVLVSHGQQVQGLTLDNMHWRSLCGELLLICATSDLHGPDWELIPRGSDMILASCGFLTLTLTGV